jgi:hypothetical protein
MRHQPFRSSRCGPKTRIYTYNTAYNEDKFVAHTQLSHMREYVRSRGFHGRLLTRPQSSHVVRTVLRITSTAFREKITTILSECIQTSGDKIPLVVLQCPQTRLFIESADRLLQQCDDGRCPNSSELVHLASLLPSKDKWCKLTDDMKFKIGSTEANTHLWCWFRLQYLLGAFVSYANVWVPGDTRRNDAECRRSSVP